MSPETDILIVGENSERFATEVRTAFRHWQVYRVDAPFALYGRRFTRAYVTKGAVDHPAWPRVNEMLVAAAKVLGGEVLPFEQYEEPTAPDLQDWEDAVLASDLRRSRYAQDWV